MASAWSAAWEIFVASWPSSIAAETHGGGDRLAMAETVLRDQLVGVRRRHFDEVAEHRVVLDAERVDAGVLAVARFELRDHAAGFVAQLAHLIEGGMRALGDEAAVAREERRLGDEKRV